MKKRIILFIVTISIVCSIPVSAYSIRLRIPHNMLSIHFSEESAVCSASCIGNTSNDELGVTLTLYENNTSVDSWTNQGTGYVSLSEEYGNLVHGKTYKLTMTWSVNGISQPSVNVEKYYS